MFFILIGIIAVLYVVYLYSIWNYSYWKKHNVPSVKPVPFFGTIKDSFLMKKTFADAYNEFYKKFRNSKYCGVYVLREPTLFAIDLDLIKTVMIKEFSSFHDNQGFDIDEKNDPFVSKNPFVLKGDQWRLVRSQISPAFSSGRMKFMFPQMTNVSNRLVEHLLNNEDNLKGKGVNTKLLCSKYAVDGVGSCVLSLDLKSFENPNSEFRKMAGRIVDSDSVMSAIKFFLISFLPKIATILGVSFVTKEIGDFFIRIIKEQAEYREKNKVIYNDFLDFLFDLRKKCTEYDFDEVHMTAHLTTFFTDGFETSSIAMSYVLFELAHRPDIQHKLRMEIDEVLHKHNGQLTYEAVMQDMKYLDCCVQESLRLHPPATFLRKVCTKKFTFPPANDTSSSYEMQPGMHVIIPVNSVHRDPQYFENPDEFIPERFSDERKHEIVKSSFLTFGDGPRQCIGSRFALMQMKVGIVTLINNFDVRVNSQTIVPLQDNPKAFLLSPVGGIWLNFNKRKDRNYSTMFLIVVALVIALYLLYVHSTWNYSYWQKCKVPHCKPIPYLGNVAESLLLRKPFSLLYDEIYKKFRKSKYCGIYILQKPAIFLIDIDLIKSVLIKDFNAFHDVHAQPMNEDDDPYFSKNPLALTGSRWKAVRNDMSLGFSTNAKMKSMFPQTVLASNELVSVLNATISLNKVGFSAKDFCSEYSVNAICSSILNLDIKTLKNTNSENKFKDMSKRLIDSESVINSIRIFILVYLPRISNIFGFGFVPRDVGTFFLTTVKDLINYRKKNNLYCNDFLDFMTELKDKGTEYGFDETYMATFIISFFTDGVETSSTAMSYTLYELARHFDIQLKLQQEIDQVVAENGNKMTYEAVLQQMKYLECCITESLRLHPPASYLRRCCTKPFTLPPANEFSSQFVIEAGMHIVVPLYSIQRDPQYYDHPDEYDPDRFMNGKKRKETFLSFGEGPRQCVGMRFAMMQIKIGIAAILQNFDVELHPRTKNPLEESAKSFLLSPVGGIWLKFNRRK